MPEYDATNYPASLAPNLTGGEVGREPPDLPAAWPAVRHLPDPYTGPVPAKEYETNTSRVLTAVAVPPVKPPTEEADASIAPPPGHLAQP
jgi:hypothetical protein